MKTVGTSLILTIIGFLVLSFSLSSLERGTLKRNDLLGAWKRSTPEGMAVTIMADGYFAVTHYNLDTKEFKNTAGGSWVLSGETLNQVIEFNTDDSSKVGTTIILAVDIKKGVLFVNQEEWQRIDAMDPGALAGAWLFAGRERNGEMTRRNPGPRKTMKLLSGTRFQWIAYNFDTREFMGTGGGNYTTQNGKYQENIEFFSRDSSRVGKSLEFDYELKEGEWHHRGLSSKGDPIYEIWAPRK